jgi:hypothetical protein
MIAYIGTMTPLEQPEQRRDHKERNEAVEPQIEKQRDALQRRAEQQRRGGQRTGPSPSRPKPIMVSV